MTGTDTAAGRRERLVVGGWLAAALLVTVGLVLVLLATTTAVREPYAWATVTRASVGGVDLDVARLVRLGGGALLAGGLVRRTGLDRSGVAAVGSVVAVVAGVGLATVSFGALGVGAAIVGSLALVGLGLARLVRAAGADDRGRFLLAAGVVVVVLGFSTATGPGTSAPYVEPWATWAMAVLGLALLAGGLALGRRAARLAGW